MVAMRLTSYPLHLTSKVDHQNRPRSPLCQSRVSVDSLQTDCERPVHRHCVSVTVYISFFQSFLILFSGSTELRTITTLSVSVTHIF